MIPRIYTKASTGWSEIGGRLRAVGLLSERVSDTAVAVESPRGHIWSLAAVQQISAAVCDSSVVYETPSNHIRPCAASQGGAADIRGRM